jgi:hypothetical protein
VIHRTSLHWLEEKCLVLVIEQVEFAPNDLAGFGMSGWIAVYPEGDPED